MKNGSFTHNLHTPTEAAVRKKDVSLLLYCDCRKLKSKIIPYKHALPRIQNIIDILGSNNFFSLLDQSKGY